MAEELLALLRAGKPPKPPVLLATLRELLAASQGDQKAKNDLTSATALDLADHLPQLEDRDADSRKAARLVHYFVSETAAQGGLGPRDVRPLFSALVSDLATAVYLPRQLSALHTLGLLSAHLYPHPQPGLVLQQETIYKATLDLVQRSREELEHLPFALLQGEASVSSKQKKELEEALARAGGLTAMVRRVLATSQCRNCPPEWMSYLMTVCFGCDLNGPGARAGFAALLELAQKHDGRTDLAVHLYSKKKVRALASIPDVPSCVLFLRLCACIAFADAGGSHNVREAFFQVLVEATVSEKRLPVNLEAVHLLFGRTHQEEGGMLPEFKRLVDVAAVVRLLCQPLQQKTTPLTTIHAVLQAVRVLGTWLVKQQEAEEEAATTNLSLTLMAAAQRAHRVHEGVLKQLMETVLTMSAFLDSRQQLSSALHLAVLQALVWLVPSLPLPSFGSTNASLFSSLSMSGAAAADGSQAGGQDIMFKGLQRRLREAPQCLTDAHLFQLVKAVTGRIAEHSVSSASTSTRLTLTQLLLQVVLGYVQAVPSDAISEATVQAWESLLRSHVPQLQTEVLASLFQILDFDDSVHWQSTVVVRPPAVWEAQGMLGPFTTAERRAAVARLQRLVCWLLGEHASSSRFPPDRLGVVLLRLQTLAVCSDYFSRSAALVALCKIAVRVDSLDVKMALFEFLQGQEAVDWDLPTSATPQAQALAALYGGSGGGVKQDLLSATLVHLRAFFRSFLKTSGAEGALLADGPASAFVDPSLLVVTEEPR